MPGSPGQWLRVSAAPVGHARSAARVRGRACRRHGSPTDGGVSYSMAIVVCGDRATPRSKKYLAVVVGATTTL